MLNYIITINDCILMIIIMVFLRHDNDSVYMQEKLLNLGDE